MRAMVTAQPLLFRKAQKEDARIIAHLVNSAYRGDSSRLGWTSEADLLDGLRTNEREVLGLIESEQSIFLLCMQGVEVVGSVHLEKIETAGYLGMFVVKPELQGRGIGRQFMRTAETTAHREWGITKMTMQVITLRHELIAFYERRGYRRTGKLKPFPTMANARVQGLQFEMLEKDLEPLASVASPACSPPTLRTRSEMDFALAAPRRPSETRKASEAYRKKIRVARLTTDRAGRRKRRK